MRKLWLILAATALVVAACGDDDSDVDADGASDAAQDATDDGAGDDGDDRGGPDDVDDFDAFLDDENCDFFLAGAFNPFGGAPPDEMDDFNEFGQQFEAVADGAPDEIRTEFTLMAERYSQYFDLLAEADVDLADEQAFQDPEVQELLTGMSEIFDTEFQDATDTVSAYVDEHCRG